MCLGDCGEEHGEFDEDRVLELTKKIREGTVDPIDVRWIGESAYDRQGAPAFDLLNGHHRFIAAKRLGVKKVPVRNLARTVVRSQTLAGVPLPRI